MIQYWHEKHRELRAQRDEEGFNGFTLIELLIVIVVLGILAATVIFALGGVTGQSAQAACNSDAKTTEVAVQAYISSPDNATNTKPSTMGNLYSAPFNSDTFETKQSNNAYTVLLGGDSPAATTPHVTQFFVGPGPAAAVGATTIDSTNPDGVFVVKSGTTTAFLYDDPGTGGTNECTQVT